MKKVFPLIMFLLGVVVVASAQQRIPYTPTKQLPKPVGSTALPKHGSTNSQRASSTQFYIDYAGMDAEIAINSGIGVSHLGDPNDPQDDAPDVMIVNTSLPRDSVGYSSYALAVYPRIIDYTTTTFPWNEYDLSKIQINVDTVQIRFGHVKNSAAGIFDTIVVSIYNLDSVQSLSFDTGVAGGRAPLFKQSFIVDTSMTGSPQPGFFSIGLLEVVPNLALPAGNTFAVQIQFFGPAADEFYLLAGWKNDCGNVDCGADLPYVGYFYNANLDFFNTLAPQRFATGDPNTPFFPYPTQYLYFDCDQDGNKNAVCEEVRTQDLMCYPTITVNIPNFYAEVTADKTFGCPGETVQLTGRAFGSSAYPFTYAFTTSSGTFNAVDDSTQELTLGAGNAVVILAVTDANNNTVYDTVTVASRGVTANINNGVDPVSIACGSTANLNVNLSGYTIGTETYAWTGGATTTTLNGVIPGSYSVTVTNSAGCTASDNAQVVYAGGVTNNVTFTPPTAPVYTNTAVTFTNTSSNTNNWIATWDVLGNQSVLIPTTNATYTYTSPGFYPVTLTMDSAGCKFVSQPQTIQVLQDGVGVNDITFESGINLQPNPTSGAVTLTINDVEKNLNIKVYNIIGSLVKEVNMFDVSSSVIKTLDLGNLSNGTYLVKIQSASKTAVKRLTINK